MLRKQRIHKKFLSVRRATVRTRKILPVTLEAGATVTAERHGCISESTSSYTLTVSKSILLCGDYVNINEYVASKYIDLTLNGINLETVVYYLLVVY
jgi:hypothetical protein